MVDKTTATVQKVKSYIGTNPEFAPSYIKTDEFLKDKAIVSALLPLQNVARQLASDLDDTGLLAGSEALSEGMFYYGLVRESANRDILKAKPIYDD